ncbi:MAG: 3-phosphoglycerate dehydrogenase [Prevotellaceae bacterium]|jgi:D-3-phosphoglycerate dehydrogenase|nr:3-phosphoglycerate dehydrogenase [Prevotellaceae bacterium]
MKIILATQKPFSPYATDRVKEIAKAEHELTVFENYKEQSELVQAVHDADAIIVRSDLVTAEVINNAPKLKIAVRAGAGYDNIDLEACTARNIVVMNTPGQNSNAVAELAVGLMIYMVRNSFTPGVGSELKNKKLGIHAYGNVGKLIATLGKGFGMEVYGFDPFVNSEVFARDGLTAVKSAQELYSLCDIVSINMPALPATVKSVNKSLLEQLKNNAILVNTARREVIDEEDLLNIMQRSRIKYATDVKPLCHEKLTDFGNRYFSTPKKMGAETEEANINAAIAAINQIVDYFKTGNQTYRVN